MITENPFSVLSEIISPTVMQIYVVAMFILVVGGMITALRDERRGIAQQPETS